MHNRPEPPSGDGRTQPHRQASRIGKVAVNAYFPKPVRDQLKLMAIVRGTTVQRLLAEAVDDLFAKYGFPEIAASD